MLHLHTKFQVNWINSLENTEVYSYTVLWYEHGTTFPHLPHYKRIFFLLLQENAAMAIHETLVIYVSLWILTKIGKKFGKQPKLRVWGVCGSPRTRYAPLFSMGRSLTVNKATCVGGQRSRTNFSGMYSCTICFWHYFIISGKNFH